MSFIIYLGASDALMATNTTQQKDRNAKEYQKHVVIYGRKGTNKLWVIG